MEDMTAMTETEMTVGQVAELFGVTVRTLHHYDEIGLLVPSARSHAGYRLYTSADLKRMQQVVVYRRLGFSLEEVGELLDGDAPAAEHLRRQRDVVMSRMAELTELVSAIDHALEAEMNDRTMTDADRRALFGDGFEDLQTEAEQRWGDSEPWRQSAARTKRYGKDDWTRLRAEQEAIFARQVATWRSGVQPSSQEAMDAVEEHRVFIDRWFYDCPREFHANLGDLYVADPRYVTSMAGEDSEGYGEWLRDAIRANAER